MFESKARVMDACPRWNSCTSKCCPLDPDWKTRLDGFNTNTCYYIKEYVIPNSRMKFKFAGVLDIYYRIEELINDMYLQSNTLRKTLKPSRDKSSKHKKQMKMPY